MSEVSGAASTNAASASKVTVVTDSTASLPADLVESLGIIVVPVSVIVGDIAHDEGSGIAPEQVAAALAAGTAVTTSRPAPEAFARAYRVATSYGARRIISVHLPQGLSGTYESALLASKHAQVPVTVIDARTTGMALGFAAAAGARFAAAGVEAEAVAAAVRETAEQSFLGVYVESLEHLRRGGRVSAARAIVGTALKFHPILQMLDGGVEVVERVRTRSRALARLVQRAATAFEHAPGKVDVAVHVVGPVAQGVSGAAPPSSTTIPSLTPASDADAVESALRETFAGRINDFRVVPLSAALAAHVGPGAVCVAVTPVLSS
ncbi:MAG: DegV family EDD domain-containing protein [Actinomycetales bacterium]|nr:DegV family EDD domain-containing protein [Actinomycetales bacterium]